MIETSIKAAELVEQHLSKMGTLVELMLKQAMQALREQDADITRHVIEQDDLVDNLQIVVEEELERLVLVTPPVGFNLRRDFTMVKIAGDLERIGDYATNIAEVVLELKNEKYIKPLVHIPQLSAVAINMVSTVLKAFNEKNPDLAEAVCRKDEEADNLYESIQDELVKILTNNTSGQVSYQASRFLLVAEWLERIADHATNIGEAIIYVATGKRVKY